MDRQRAQLPNQTLPIGRGEPSARKERSLEPADRVSSGEKVVTYLPLIDDRALSVGKLHRNLLEQPQVRITLRLSCGARAPQRLHPRPPAHRQLQPVVRHLLLQASVWPSRFPLLVRESSFQVPPCASLRGLSR